MAYMTSIASALREMKERMGIFLAGCGRIGLLQCLGKIDKKPTYPTYIKFSIFNQPPS